ncbi:MAG: hypothetical protein RL685_3669, partial [Pseudomonadota bacterium]
MSHAISRREPSRASEPRTVASELIELSPIEQVFTGAGACPITFLFEFDRPLDAQALQASLAGALRGFPLLQARLIEDGPRGVALQPDAALGALHVCSEAASEAEVAAALAPLALQSGCETARFTLVQRATGCTLAASMSHAVVDGFAFVSFLYHWARSARGLPGIALSRQSIAPSIRPEPVTAERVLADCGAFWLPGQKRSVAAELRLECRRFRHDELALERAQIRATHGANVSDNDLIAAHLWREFGPRLSSVEAEAYLTCPVDARPLCRALGRSHMGCAITFATAALPIASLQQLPLAELALTIRKAVGAVTEERVSASMSTLAALREQQGPGVLDEIHLTHPARGLLVTNLSRLPLQELDFGAGQPRSFEA